MLMLIGNTCFNTQPPEGGWKFQETRFRLVGRFQHTAARRRLALVGSVDGAIQERFNTQPPEGGWSGCQSANSSMSRFNTQPPEGGWQKFYFKHIKHL